MGEDRISDLPDSLIHHILSFLPTKSVVSTSTLSNRWKYLWTSIPVLDFLEWWFLTDDEDDETKSFVNFTDRLASRDDMPNIRRFCLKIDDDLFDTRANAWISTLVRRKVEELTLMIIVSSAHFEFPKCLFMSEKLTKLDIESYYYNLILPESISFPRLKILRLETVILRDEKLLSNCPVLEQLSLSYCTWIGKIGNMVDQPAGVFNFPVLKELRFSDCRLDLEVMYDLCILAPALECLYFEVDIGGVKFDDRVINIYAPSLLSLVYWNAVARDYILSSFSSLVDADIGIRFSEENTYAASKLIGALSTVKRLKMSVETFTGFHWDQTDVDESWTLNVVPQCLLLHLKSIKFRGFLWDPMDLNVVKIFLKNARVLQRMTIDLKNWENDKMEEVMDQILLVPRGSTSCVVNFST